MTPEEAAARRARLTRLLLAERGVAADRRVVPVPRTGTLRASLAQERMWFMDRVAAPRSFLHNVPLGARLRGPLQAKALQAAVDALVARHEGLRTAFSPAGPILVARRHDEVDLPIAFHDLSGADHPWALVERLDYLDARSTFDLTRAPLLRVMLLRVAEDDHVLLATAHHAVWDGWSTGILVQELAAHYRAARAGADPGLPPFAIQYHDWADWEHRFLSGDTLRRHADFWRRELAGARPVHVPAVVTDTTGITSDRGRYVTFGVPPPLVAALDDLARAENVTLFVVLLAGFTALLHRLTGADDLSVGGLIANRTSAEIEELIGYFVNMVPVRSRVAAGTTFSEHVRRTHATMLGVQQHQGLPRGRIVRAQADEAWRAFDAPPYTVTFQLQTAPRAEVDFGDLQFEIFDRHSRTAGFDLGMVLWHRLPDLRQSAGLRGWCEYRTDRFDERAVQETVERYVAVLAAAARAPAVPLAELEVFTPAEQAAGVLRGPEHEGPAAGAAAAVRSHAAARPASVAVRDERGALTYRELDAALAAATGQLREQGVGPEAVVAVAGSGTTGMLVAVGAALACGAACLAIDPTHAGAPAADLLAEARPAVAFVDAGVDVLLPPCTPRLTLGDGSLPGEGADPAPPLALGQVVASPDGTVTLPHAALNSQTHAFAAALRLGPGDVVAQCAPDAFTGGLPRLLAPLLAGAELQLLPSGLVQEPLALAAELAEAGVTVAHLPPSALAGLVDAGAAQELVLRCVVVAADALPGRTRRRWRAAFPHVRLLTGHEVAAAAGTVALFEPVDDWLDTGSCAIGDPVAGNWLYVLDAALAAVPPGARGELYVGGDGIGRGFLGDPRRTASRFVPDPFYPAAGARMYRTGRIASRRPGGPLELQPDGPPTVDGRPVDVAAVDAVLAGDPGVREAVTVVRRDRESGDHLVAYVVPSAGPGGEAGHRHLERWREVSNLIGGPSGRGLGRPATDGTLLMADAADLEDVPAGRYDFAVLDSVVHRLPSAEHLEGVLRRLVDRVRPGGRVGLVGLRDLSLRRAALSAVELDRALPDEPVAHIRARVEWALRSDVELALDPRLVLGLGEAISRIAAVEVLPSAGPGDWFDAVLHLDDAPSPPPAGPALGWATGGLAAVEVALRAAPPSLTVWGIPHRRGMAALAAERALDEPLPGATAAGLRQAVAPNRAGAAPGDVADLAGRHGYTTAMGLDLGAPGQFEAVLTPDGTAGSTARLATVRRPAGPLATTPTRVAHDAELATALRRRLRGRLPASHVPAAIVVLTALPRLRDGVPMRDALPPPATPRRTGHPRVAPRDGIEREVAAVWSDVLGLSDLGLEDRLLEDLDAGGYHAAVLAERLRAEFQVEMRLPDLWREPTVAAVARRVALARDEEGG